MRLLAISALAALAAAAAAQPRYEIKTDPARLDRLKKTPLPKIDRPVAFNTPAADAVCAALEVFPPDNPWNTLVTDWPVHPRSKQIVATVGAEKPLRANQDMAFVIVPPGQPRVPLAGLEYKDESDPGPYPIPDEMPIEGWPVNYRDRADKLS
ncbi:MAG TPA: hypothetical protein VH092_36745, partial [Urbifossiella sp.]|nr:hypothetical protein [Urbifossiella sp.]